MDLKTVRVKQGEADTRTQVSSASRSVSAQEETMPPKRLNHNLRSVFAVGLLAGIMFTLLPGQSAASLPPKRALLLSLHVPLAGIYHDRVDTGFRKSKMTYFSGGIGGGELYSPVGEQLSSIPRMELGIGGKVSKNLVVGATLQATVGYGTTRPLKDEGAREEIKLVAYSLGALPYLKVLLPHKRAVVPFLLVTGGFRMEKIKLRFPDGDIDLREKTPRGVAGLGGGISIFVGRKCTIDLTLSGMFEKGKIIFKYYNAFDHDGEGATTEGEYDSMRVYGDATLGVSVWI
jgi:hypothetical protein